MFKQPLDTRQSEASFAWLSQFECERARRIGRSSGALQIEHTQSLGKNVCPTVPVTVGQAPSQLPGRPSRRSLKALANWLFRVGERLARWKLAFLHYPLD